MKIGKFEVWDRHMKTMYGLFICQYDLLDELCGLPVTSYGFYHYEFVRIQD